LKVVKASKELKELNILYVEDEDDIREGFALILQRGSKELYIATNGQEALELFARNFVDIVVSDIKMPKMNGLEMAKKIKDLSPETPIVFTTAFSDNDYLKEAIEIGVDGYILKPIDRNRVFEKLNHIANNVIAQKKSKQYFDLIKLMFEEQKEAVALLSDNLIPQIYNTAFKTSCINTQNPVSYLVDNCKNSDGNALEKSWFMDVKDAKETTLLCEDGEKKHYLQVSIKNINDYLILNILDITDLKNENESFRHKALIDELTRVYNRKIINEMEDTLFGTNICMILLDIDNFKMINDTYGHLNGDEVLKVLATNIKCQLRQSDTVIRWGGEEFVVLLQNITDDIAKKVAEKLRLSIKEIYIKDVGHFTCSFGVSCKKILNSSDLDRLFKSADDALYKAKKEGKDRVEVAKDSG
jgi:diguanylate cyclase (GGDEF)-like protein